MGDNGKPAPKRTDEATAAASYLQMTMMWRASKILVLLGFFITAAFECDGNNSACSGCQSGNDQTAAQVPQAVSLGLEILKRTSAQFELQLTVINTGKKSVLVVTDPVRLDGSRGAYLSVNENNSSQLDLAFAVYPPPFYTRLAPKTSVTFRRLEAGGIYQKTVVLDTPLTETKPPWGDTPHVQTVDLAKIRQVKASIGVLPDDPGVNDVIANERTPDGFELVKSGPLRGKLLFELQIVVSSKILKL